MISRYLTKKDQVLFPVGEVRTLMSAREVASETATVSAFSNSKPEYIVDSLVTRSWPTNVPMTEKTSAIGWSRTTE